MKGRKTYTFRACDKTLVLGETTRLMGVVNVTPDSFSDGGLYPGPEEAIAGALALVQQGADILDIGGESTRPGAVPVPADREIERVLPVIRGLRRELPSIVISIDTYKAETARVAVLEGADVINDISGFQFEPGLAQVVADLQAGAVLSHCRGNPVTMTRLPPSDNILQEIEEGLQVSVNTAYKSHIPRDRMILDPGIGFGKNAEENLKILNRLSFLEKFDLPVLVGPSRKRFIGSVLGAPATERLVGTLAAASAALLEGAHLLRVHDVLEIRQLADVLDAVRAERVLE